MSEHHDFMDIVNFLDKFEGEFVQEQKEVFEKNAKQLAQRIKADSPVLKQGTGKWNFKNTKRVPRGTYQKGWTYRKVAEDKSSITFRIFNRSVNSPLVHLLEFGHSKSASGEGADAPAIQHVLKNRDIIEDEIIEELQEAVIHAAEQSV